MLREASGLQGLLGSGEARVRPGLPREHRAQFGHRGWSWPGRNKGAQAGAGHPCVRNDEMALRRSGGKGGRAPRGQRESLREVKQGGDSQSCI